MLGISKVTSIKYAMIIFFKNPPKHSLSPKKAPKISFNGVFRCCHLMSALTNQVSWVVSWFRHI